MKGKTEENEEEWTGMIDPDELSRLVIAVEIPRQLFPYLLQNEATR